MLYANTARRSSGSGKWLGGVGRADTHEASHYEAFASTEFASAMGRANLSVLSCLGILTMPVPLRSDVNESNSVRLIESVARKRSYRVIKLHQSTWAKHTKREVPCNRYN